MSKQPQLGDLAKDTITGFKGIIVTKTEWLNKCVRVGLQPRELHEGKPIDMQHFDIEQIEVITADALNIDKPPTGGDRNAPPNRPDVRR